MTHLNLTPKVLVVTPGLGRQHRGSFVRVAEGLVTGLLSNQVNAVLWDAPLDPEDAEDGYPDLRGVTHLIFVGPPLFALWVTTLLQVATAQGILTYWMIAANSTTLPANARAFALQHRWTKLLTPSRWSASVIRSVDEALPSVLVVPHGVEVPHEGYPVTHPIEWAHAVAGGTGRKGTEELLEAVGDDIPLAIYADTVAYGWLYPVVQGRPNVRLLRAYGSDDVPGWWAHEHIVHPSRAEGFGLSLVEAALLGRTVVARADTGEPYPLHVTLIRPKAGEEPWATWEGGDGERTHPLGNIVAELTIAPASAIRRALLAAQSDEAKAKKADSYQAWRATNNMWWRRKLFSHHRAVWPFLCEVKGASKSGGTP